MKIFKPSYFDSFRCIASSCPDSCCKEWEVEVDDASAALYRNLEGPLGDRLRRVLRDDPQWGTVMTIKKGRCPMWRTDGLCRIQAELGHDALCKTCRDFPRLRHDYGTFLELGLELSCPEAARLILSAPNTGILTEEVPGGDAPDYDESAMKLLLESRNQALEFLQNPAWTIPEALAVVLCYGYHIQSLLYQLDMPEFIPEDALEEAEDLALPGKPSTLFSFLAKLEILNPKWKKRLKQRHQPTAWTEEFRRLARYFVERYWLQAISDYDLSSRVKLGVISCVAIRLLGGDLTQTAQAFSKEIENNAANVAAILDGSYTDPALTDRYVFGLLLLL